MFEDKILEISESECRSDFDNKILDTYSDFLISGQEISDEERGILESLLALRDASLISSNAEIHRELLKYGIENCDVEGNDGRESETDVTLSPGGEIIIPAPTDDYHTNFQERVIPILDAFDENGLYPVIEDFEEADKLIDEGYFILIDSDEWTLDTSIAEKSLRGDQRGLVYAHPSVYTLMNIIVGMLDDNGVDYTPNIGSLLRPVPYNDNLHGASERSPHTRGIGLDLNLGSDDLEQILKDLDAQGNIVLTIETDHYHITLANPDKLMLDSPDFLPEIISPEEMTQEYVGDLFSESFESQIGPDITTKFLAHFWNEIKDAPQDFINQKGAMQGSHSFLFPLFRDFTGELTDEEKVMLDGKTLDFDIFYTLSNGRSIFGSRRVHFDAFINPRAYPVTDEFSRGLQENQAIADSEFRDFSTDVIMQELFVGEDYASLEIDKESIARNMELFYAFFMDVESDFQNVANRNPDLNERSSAKSPYQIQDGVIDGIENTSLYNTDAGLFTTFQTYLNRIVLLLGDYDGESAGEYGELFDDAKMQSRESLLFSPQDMSSSELSILVLGSLLHIARDKPELKYLLQRAFLMGDMDAIVDIYARFHHTDEGHRATSNRVTQRRVKYEDSLIEPQGSEALAEVNLKGQLAALIGNPIESETDISGMRAQIMQRMLLLLGYKVSNLEFSGEMVANYGPSSKNALIEFQVKAGVIPNSNHSAAGKFGPGTKAMLLEQVTTQIENIMLIDENFIGPLEFPGLRREDIINVFSR